MITTAIKEAIGTVTGSNRNSRTSNPHAAAHGSGTPQALHTPASPQAKPQEISILMVDDDPAILEIAKTYLEEEHGITVIPALSAADGLKLMEQIVFDAIVSDYQMPVMNGIEFLREVRRRSRTVPFIILTGNGGEEVAIEALNRGADQYVRKSRNPKALYRELALRIRYAMKRQRADAEMYRRHAILRAILAASPNGIAYVRDRTFQWVNESLAAMLGYRREELQGIHLKKLYENPQVYDEIGNRIQQDLKTNGRSTLITRFRHREGFCIDAEIHIAPLDTGNLHFGHMILMNDISKKVAEARKAAGPVGLPHTELNPVIEVTPGGQITYYNDAAMAALAQYGSHGTLEEFFPPDLPEILLRMDEKGIGSIFRDVMIGTALFHEHITLSPQFRIARISAVKEP